MRLDRLTTWNPAPGRVVRWRPTRACQDAADAAPVHPGPPSFLQGDHLGAYRATVERGGTHRAWTGTATRLDGEADLDALARALTAFVRRHEGMRTWFDLTSTAPQRHLVPADAIAFEYVDQPSEPSTETDWSDAWYPLVEGLFDRTCTPDSWTPFLLGAIVREGSFDLFWGCDHAFTDGASQLMVLTELADLYAEALTGDPDPTPAADQAGFLGYVEDERIAAAAYGPGSPEVRAWVDVITGNDGRLPQPPVDLGLAPGETAPVLPRDVIVLSGEEIAAFEARCRASGAGFTSGVFAALALADTSYSAADRWLGITVVGTRGPAYRRSQGWLCNFVPVEFAIPESRDFAETTRAAEDGFRRAKALATLPVHVALGTLLAEGVLGLDQLGSPQLVSYLDLRRFPGVGTPAYDNAVHFTGEGRTGNASIWVNREVDRLQVGAQTPDTPVAQAAMDDYHERIRGVFQRVIPADAAHHR